jgi:hypothetical protein
MYLMNGRSWTLLIMLLAFTSALACGEDGDPADQPVAGSAGGASGASGSGGSGGGGAGGGTGGAPSAMTTVMCGTGTCMAPAIAAGFITPCCADQATSTCGTSLMGSACAAAPVSDPRCPSASIMGFIMLASCCTAQGECGIDASQFGMSCVSLSAAASGAMGMGMGLPITLPEPRNCDGSPVVDDDGGV